MRLSVFIVPLLLVGCAASPVPEQFGSNAIEVNTVCFVRQIDEWNNVDESAFTFDHDGGEYLVSLSGVCPQLADSTSPAYIITRRSAASRCLNPGDTLRFGASNEQPSYCTVSRLFRVDAD